MIQVGTLCVIVECNCSSLLGRQCTVIALHPPGTTDVDGFPIDCDIDIDLAAFGYPDMICAARFRNLLPISPDDTTARETRREVTA